MDIGMSKINKTTFADKIIIFLYGLYFILKPFYFWPSGLPQLSDAVFIFMMGILLIKKGMSIQYDSRLKKLIFTGFLFSIYVLVANLVWMLILNGSKDFVITSGYYIYNFLIVLVIATLYFDYSSKLVQVTYKATLISLIIQIIMYIIGGGFSGGRMVAGFNNPNQLGYFSLLSMAILIISSQRIKVKLSGFILGFSISLILCLSSLSKAAIIAYGGMLLFFIISIVKNKKHKRRFNIFILLLVFTFLLLYKFNSDVITSNNLYTAVQNRISSIGRDKDDSLEVRGYNRLFEHPEYWIFGAGEGEYTRFRYNSLEFHSTLGNIQVSYGLVGLSLFARFLYLALKNDRFRNWYLIGSILVYGLSHNGIRNSLFWILIALISISWNQEYLLDIIE